jgi:hypothetical protein
MPNANMVLAGQRPLTPTLSPQERGEGEVRAYALPAESLRVWFTCILA